MAAIRAAAAPLAHAPGAPLPASAQKTGIPLLTLPQTLPAVHLPTSTLHPGEHSGVTGICHVYNLSCKTQDNLNTFP